MYELANLFIFNINIHTYEIVRQKRATNKGCCNSWNRSIIKLINTLLYIDIYGSAIYNICSKYIKAKEYKT